MLTSENGDLRHQKTGFLLLILLIMVLPSQGRGESPKGRGEGWSTILHEVNYGPYDQQLINGELILSIKNKEPFNEITFSNFLTELGGRLAPTHPPFEKIVLSAGGGNQSRFLAVISLKDVRSYLKKEISQPELVRRFGIKIEETIQSLREKSLTARKEGRLEEAVDWLEQWIKKEPESLFVLSLLGNVYRDSKRYWDAISVYQKLLATSPNTPLFASHNLGFCFEKVGAFSDSIASYKKALDADPHNLLLIQQLAEVLRKDGKSAEALEWIARARSIQDSFDLWLIEGNVRRDEKKYKLAREAYLKAQTLNPHDGKVLFNLIAVDLETKQYTDAKKKYEELKEKDAELAKELERVFDSLGTP